MPAAFHVMRTGYLPPDRSTKSQWVPARIGFLPSGEAIATDGRLETTSIGVAAGSHLIVDLAARYRRFRFKPGPQAREAYTIKVDGKAVPHLVRRDGSVDLNVAKAHRLELIAPSPRSGSNTFIWYDLRLEAAM
jgi:hypothetical protein